MENKIFRFYSDASHGWLAVKRKELRELGILDKISSCSYQRGDTVYLEEDNDLIIFAQAFEAKFGKQPTIKDCFYASVPVRSYEHFFHNPV